MTAMWRGWTDQISPGFFSAPCSTGRWSVVRRVHVGHLDTRWEAGIRCALRSGTPREFGLSALRPSVTRFDAHLSERVGTWRQRWREVTGRAISKLTTGSSPNPVLTKCPEIERDSEVF